MSKPPAIRPARSRGSSSPQVLQTYVWMDKNGFRAVPLHKQSKAATSKAYVDTTYTPPPISYWKENDLGIGIATGPLHSGPVDCDLDCEEAVFFARHFLPPTSAVFGRSGKPQSHYLYRPDTTFFDKIAFTDPVSKSTIVEARGDGGHQTVMPGSLHESSGELIEWDSVAFPEVTSVATEQLARAVRKIAIATMIARYIWQDGYRNEPTKHLSGVFFYLEWSVEEAEEMIAALMAWSDDDDKSRIPTVRATYKRGAAGKKVSGAGVLRKQLNDDRIVDRILEWAGNPTINLLQEYNDRYAVVAVGGKFRIAETDVTPGKPPIFYMKDDWLNLVATDKITIVDDKGKDKTIPKGLLWLNSDRRRAYKNVDFLPGEDESATTLNLWGGWAVKPDPKASCSGFLQLLHDVICGGDDELNDWMLHWFANIVREPMKKSLTAPVIIGPEGAGKSLMVAYFGEILGEGTGYTPITNDNHLHGQFNHHMATTLLLHSEEALYGGDKKHAGIIRSLITDNTRIYEQKGIDARSVKNFLRLIILSNLPRAAPVAVGDRRYTVIDMKERKITQELLDVVLEEFYSDGPAALFHYLLNMDYDPRIPRTNVKNESLSDMKAHNFSPLDGWWYNLLQSGVLLPSIIRWASKDENEDWPSTVGSPALYLSFVSDMKDRNVRNIPSDISFAIHLNKIMNNTLQKAQRTFDNSFMVDLMGVPQIFIKLGARQNAIVNLPNLATCRLAFEKHVGQPLEWPEPEEIKPRFKEKAPHEKF